LLDNANAIHTGGTRPAVCIAITN